METKVSLNYVTRTYNACNKISCWAMLNTTLTILDNIFENNFKMPKTIKLIQQYKYYFYYLGK